MQPILVLTGPTAVGKTALSLVLAEHLDAEIISADSRQVYQELTIGTAKPSPEELASVPHHFINELSLEVPFSAGAFAEQAHARIQQIRSRGKRVLVVGGSTLYLHALQFGLSSIPPTNPKTRKHLAERLHQGELEELFAELQDVDPASAATMDSSKSQRVLRALEVYYDTGKPLSAYHEEQAPPPYSFDVVVLHRDRARLYERINARVEAMLETGLLDEVRGLLARGVDLATPPLRTIGYREAIAHLQGLYDQAEMVRLIKRNSRRYAKRQLTWFRRYPTFTWVDIESSWDISGLQ